MTKKTFSQIRKSSMDLDNLTKKIKDSQKKKDFSDKRFWSATVDKAKSADTIIRFLPGIDEGELPYVTYYSHNFENNGKWYIQNCPTSVKGFGDNICPCCDKNNEIWSTGSEGEEIVRGKNGKNGRKRKLHYVANILVVSDPAHSENEGKVFLFAFGPKIYEKLKEKLVSEDADIRPIPIFDLFVGANFRLKIRSKDGYTSYEKSFFDDAKSVSDDEKKIEDVYNSQYSLKEFTDEKFFKTYDELKKSLDRCLGGIEASILDNDLQSLGSKSHPTKDESDTDVPFEASSSEDLNEIEKLKKEFGL